MKILLGHTFSKFNPFGSIWVEEWVGRLRDTGISIDAFSLVIDEKHPVIYFSELDALWRYRDRNLMGLYEHLARKLEDYDVFVCYTGANVHPEFVKTLKCFTVYGCFDDPESSDILSKPVAASFDLAMVGNIAEVETYRSWGVKNVRWWPLGFRQGDYNPLLTEDDILRGSRPIEVALLCERLNGYRRHRVDQFARAFPKGSYYGRGWPAGFLPESKRVSLLQSTQIGVNIHNSTGPINFRTFYLPANGVMQICDNRSHLAKIFELDKEVVGYDSIKEAIELSNYYLAHDQERRAVAANGWKRVLKDYNEGACFQFLMRAVGECMQEKKYETTVVPYNFEARDGIFTQLINKTHIKIFQMNRLAYRFFRWSRRKVQELLEPFKVYGD